MRDGAAVHYSWWRGNVSTFSKWNVTFSLVRYNIDFSLKQSGLDMLHPLNRKTVGWYFFSDSHSQTAESHKTFLLFRLKRGCIWWHFQTHSFTPQREGRRCQVKWRAEYWACFSSWLAPCLHQQSFSSKATNAGAGADSALTMSYYPPAVAPVRWLVPLKNRSLAGAKVNPAVRLSQRLHPQPCVTENRLRGINKSAWGSNDRGVSVCVRGGGWVAYRKWGRARWWCLRR